MSTETKGTPERMFPIMHGFPAIPWDVIAPHEPQAVENHGQSLARLAERGGLSPGEAYCVLNDIALNFKLDWKTIEALGEKLVKELAVRRGG